MTTPSWKKSKLDTGRLRHIIPATALIVVALLSALASIAICRDFDPTQHYRTEQVGSVSYEKNRLWLTRPGSKPIELGFVSQKMRMSVWNLAGHQVRISGQRMSPQDIVLVWGVDEVNY